MRCMIDNKEFSTLLDGALSAFGMVAGKRAARQPGVRLRIKAERKRGRLYARMVPDKVSVRKLKRWTRDTGKRFQILRRGIWVTP